MAAGTATGLLSRGAVEDDLAAHHREHRPALEDETSEGSAAPLRLEAGGIDLALAPEVEHGDVGGRALEEAAAGQAQDPSGERREEGHELLQLEQPRVHQTVETDRHRSL